MSNIQDIEQEVKESLTYCAKVFSDLYNIPLKRAIELLWDSPFPRLLGSDPVAFGQFSYHDWSEETYKYHKRLGNI